MPKKSDGRGPTSRRRSGVPAAQELKGDIDAGRTGDKVAFPDPATAPLGTDDEAAGTPDDPSRVRLALAQELAAGAAPRLGGATTARPRPVSPNIQIYRPQLTSVLSIANRITGVLLSLAAVGLVAWLLAAAAGPEAYSTAQQVLGSWPGQILLFGATFAFFLHFFGGVRHLVWDTVHAFDLRSIYASGWAVIAASVLATAAVWVWRLGS